MKDLAELAIQNFCSYESYPMVDSINRVKVLANFEKFYLKKKNRNFSNYAFASPRGVMRVPRGDMNVPERGSSL